MTQPEPILAAARTVVVVDWPSRDVPDTLARAGYTVLVKGGPEPDSYTAYEVTGGEVVPRRAGAPPDSADLVYAHRPVASPDWSQIAPAPSRWASITMPGSSATGRWA